MKPSILTTRYFNENSVLPSIINLMSGRAPKRGNRYLTAIVVPIMLWIASYSGNGYPQESANALRITGAYLGLPSDATDEKSGGTDGIIGIRYLYLNYENPFNYFGTIGLSVNAFTDSENLDRASDREELSSSSASELTFTGYVFSGGVTYNANQFDNVVFIAGIEAMLGETLAEYPNGRFEKVDDNRIGLVAGAVLGFEGVFVGVDYATTTESIRLSMGIDL